jgi:uncharacterized protein (TIGR03083 family)
MREPDVPLDYASIISEESARIVSANERDPTARVPWSERWTVGTVARHVAGTHHVVAEIIRGRPDADFGLFGDLPTPSKGSPEFAGWFRSGTALLLEQLATVPDEDECWSWFAPGRHVGWWGRRMAFEAVVHRFDADAAQQQRFSVEPEVAADGVDEYLDVFVAATRATHNAPAGPTVSFECSDRDDRWWLSLSESGGREYARDPRAASVRIRATAQELLLVLWGRIPISGSPGVEISGDVEQLDRWSEFVPSM